LRRALLRAELVCRNTGHCCCRRELDCEKVSLQGRIDAFVAGIVLEKELAPGMYTGDLAGIDQRLDFLMEVVAPVEEVLPVNGRNSGVGQDVSVRLLNLPVILEAIKLCPS
jgi:hypothetical protein